MNTNINMDSEKQNLNKVSMESEKKYSFMDYLKFIGFSIFGLLLFFAPITINGINSIPLDHLISFINKIIPKFGPIFTVVIATVGGILPWYDKSYKKGTSAVIMSILRTLGIPVVFMAFFNIGPIWLISPNMLPLLWAKVVVAVTMIVPIGSIFLTFIICYGCLEFIGVLVKPIMRPIYNVPGKAAIDAVASFVGSFSVAIYLTNKLYNEGRYTNREAVIIMTGFSTVSATSLIIIAKIANMMDMWNFYFWSSLVITFIVTAITLRLWPIRSMDNSYIDGKGKPEIDIPGNLFANAIKEGVKAAAASNSLAKAIWENLIGGIKMCFILTPSMASIGILSFILINMTSVFDVVGYIFYPFTYILAVFGLPEPLMIAKACSAVIAEMLVPNILVAKLPLAAKYVVGVVSVSSILFCSGSIPCILASDVKLRPIDMLIIWFERTVISILLAGIVALLVL